MIITLIIIFLQPWSIPHQTERHFWKNATDWGASSQWPSEHHSWKIAQVLDTTNTYTCQLGPQAVRLSPLPYEGHQRCQRSPLQVKSSSPMLHSRLLGLIFIMNEVFKNDDFADDWDAWPTTRRQTRILTWPELVTKMLPWLRISKYFKAIRGGGTACIRKAKRMDGIGSQYLPSFFYQTAGGVLHVRESLEDCAGRAWDAEGEEGHSLSKVPPRTGRAGGLHEIKKLYVRYIELLLFQVKHAKAHAQMLRQTISAIKTEVWDWRIMGHTARQMSWIGMQTLIRQKHNLSIV